MIAIIDYDAGNLKSVEKALQSIGEDTIVSRDREEILRADKVILPGVGSFGDAMQKLRDYKLDEVIKEVTESGKPFLGICLGLQLLFLRIPDHEGLKIPHMGWNSLELINQGRLFQNLPADPYVYFVHSYYLKAEEPEIVKATTWYSTTIHASVEKGNIFACQFHPEKSSDVGLQILWNFAAIGKEENGYVYEKNHSMSGCS